MSKKNPQTERLKALLEQVKQNSEDYEDDYIEAPLEPGRQVNSHTLYQEVAGKLAAEQDIYIVKEIALHYLNHMCASIPDTVATEIALRVDGL